MKLGTFGGRFDLGRNALVPVIQLNNNLLNKRRNLLTNGCPHFRKLNYIASAGLLKKKQFGQFIYPQVSNFQFSKTALRP